MAIHRETADFTKLDVGVSQVRVLGHKVSTFKDQNQSLSLVVGPGGEGEGTAWWSVGGSILTTLDLASAAGAFGVPYEDAVKSLKAEIEAAAEFGHEEAGKWLVKMSKKPDGAPIKFWVSCWHKKDKYAMARPYLPDKRYLSRFLGFTPQSLFAYSEDGNEEIVLPEPFSQTWKSEEGDSTGKYIYAVFVVTRGKFMNYPVWFKVRLNHTVAANSWSFSENSGIAELGDALGAWPLFEKHEAKNVGKVLFKDEREVLGLFSTLCHGRLAEITVKDGKTGWGNIVAPLDDGEDVEDAPKAVGVYETAEVDVALVALAKTAGMPNPVTDGKLTATGKQILGKLVKPLIADGTLNVDTKWPMGGLDVQKVTTLLSRFATLDNVSELMADEGDAAEIQMRALVAEDDSF